MNSRDEFTLILSSPINWSPSSLPIPPFHSFHPLLEDHFDSINAEDEKTRRGGVRRADEPLSSPLFRFHCLCFFSFTLIYGPPAVAVVVVDVRVNVELAGW